MNPTVKPTVNPPNSTDNIRQLIELIERTRKPFEIAGIPAALVPSGTELTLFESLLDKPHRLKQVLEFHTPESFLLYYKKYCSPASIILCDLHAGQFLGVIDYHTSSSSPGWCKHTIRYTCPKTREWKQWHEKNQQWMTQEEFAYFIEDHQEEILNPPGAEMLEIALTLQTKTNVEFRRGIRLDNGQIQLSYQETIEGSAGPQGNIRIPSMIKIGLQLFEGGKGYELDARFRYRVKDGHLRMSYQLVRPNKTHEAAVNAVYSEIAESMESGTLLNGKIQ